MTEAEQNLFHWSIGAKIDGFLTDDKEVFRKRVEGFTNMREMNNLINILFGAFRRGSEGEVGSRSDVERVMPLAKKIDQRTVNLADLFLLDHIEDNDFSILFEIDELETAIKKLNQHKNDRNLIRSRPFDALLQPGDDQNKYKHYAEIFSGMSMMEMRQLNIQRLRRVALYLVACNMIYKNCFQGALIKPENQKRECERNMGKSPESDSWYKGCIEGIDRHIADQKGGKKFSTTSGMGIYYGNNPYEFLEHFGGKGMVCSAAGKKKINLNERDITGRSNKEVMFRVGILVQIALRTPAGMGMSESAGLAAPNKYNPYFSPQLFEIASDGYIIEDSSVSGHTYVSKFALDKRNCRYINITDFKTCKSFYYEKGNDKLGLIPHLDKRGLLDFLLKNSVKTRNELLNRYKYFVKMINGCIVVGDDPKDRSSDRDFKTILKDKVNQSEYLKEFFQRKPPLRQYLPAQ
jgi:hypothetical protein